MGAGVGGIGGSDTNVIAPQQTVSGTGNGAQGSGQAARDQGRNVRGTANYAEAGGVANKNGTYVSPNGNNVKAGNNSTITVTSADPSVAIAAINASQNSLSSFLQASQQQAAASNSSTNALLSKFLDQTGTLTTQAQTGGASVAASTYTRLFLWALGIVAVAGVAIFYLRRK